jgi:hypothetical protein
MSGRNSMLDMANKLYVAIIDAQTIAVCKSRKDANKVLKSKKYYVIPSSLQLHRDSKIFYYELFSMYLRVFPRLNDGLVGKVFSIDELRDILYNSELFDTYNCKVLFEQITPSLVDKYIDKTKKDLDRIEKWKERPKIYYFGDSDIRGKLVEYARNNGKEISENVYFYEKDNKYMVIDTWNWVGITLPKDVNILDYEDEIRQQLKNDYVRRRFKEMISIMLDVPELQEIASQIMLLDLI